MATLPTLAYFFRDIHLCQSHNLHIRRPVMFLCPVSVHTIFLTGFTICSFCILKAPLGGFLKSLAEVHKVTVFIYLFIVSQLNVM